MPRFLSTAIPVGSLPSVIRFVTASVRVLMKATVPACGASGNVELRTSARLPDGFNAIGPVFGPVFGKIRVIDRNAHTLPEARSITDTPPSPDTQTEPPPFANAIPWIGPTCGVRTVRTILFVDVFTTQRRPSMALPTHA